jgi:hypothetical protein
MFIAWLNTVKKVKLEYTKKTDKFVAKNIFELDLGSVYFTGFNIHMHPECSVYCQFNYPIEPGTKVLPRLTL